MTTGSSDLVRQAPKAELHVHLPGCVRPATLADLSRRHGVALPLPADALYDRVNSHPTPEEADAGPWFPLLAVYELICRCLRTVDDFARAAYEAIADAVTSSNVRYQEISFSPSVHMAQGTRYTDMVEGLAAGLRAAEHDFGARAAFIAAINREAPPAEALAVVEEMVAHPCADVVGIGLDFDERKGAPELFSHAYALARRHGLHRTAHAGEHVGGLAGAANVAKCLDLLGCERIDHGYYVLEDGAVLRRCREEGVPFDVAFTTSRRALRPWRRSRIALMWSEGLQVNVSSDDPSLFPTTVAAELETAGDELGLSPGEQMELVANSFRASFLPPEAKAAFLAELGRFATAHGAPAP